MMANDVDAGKQEALEARFKDFAGSPLDQNMNVRDVFGDMDEWTLELGPYRFLLLPFNGDGVAQVCAQTVVEKGINHRKQACG